MRNAGGTGADRADGKPELPRIERVSATFDEATDTLELEAVFAQPQAGRSSKGQRSSTVTARRSRLTRRPVSAESSSSSRARPPAITTTTGS